MDRDGEIPNVQDLVVIPKWIRIFISIPAVIMGLFSFIHVLWKLFDNTHALPIDFKPVELLFYSLSWLIIVNAPWGALLSRIKKIGPIELQNAIDTQIKEIVSIEERLDILESSIDRTDSATGVADMMYETPLKNKLLEFLVLQRPAAYSPLRIKEWGSIQAGFDIFAKHDISILRRYLRKLVAEGKLTTAISRKGNILYRIPEE